MFVMNQMTSGGAERVVSVIANKMVEKNYKVSIIITFKSEIHYNLNSNIDIINFNISTDQSQILRNIIEIKKLINTLKKEKPDVVISFIRNVNSIIASNIARIPIIISERNNPKYDPKSKMWRIARKIVYPYADGIVFQSEGAKSYFSKSIQDKSCIILNPLDDNIPIKKYNDSSNKEIVTVGRLCDQKDQVTLINAFSKFHKKYSEYKLVIYGEGDLRDELNSLINSLNLNQYIEMPGSVKDIHKKIQNSEVFVLSSKYEGYPNSLIEAMAIGLPVISTDCDYGPREIIENYKNGILVPVGDVNKMEKELSRLVVEKDIKLSISSKAINIREKLDANNIVEQWIDYISTVTKKSKVT